MSAPLKSFGLTTFAALIAGALSVAGFAPVGLWPLPFIAFAVLYALLSRAPRPRDALRLGFAFAMGMFGAGLSWVYVSMHVYGDLSPPLAALATLVYCACHAIFPMLAAGAHARFTGGRGGPATIAFAAWWTFADWLRGAFPFGFPGLVLGNSQTDSPLAGFAPITGVYGLTFATALCGTLLWIVASGTRRERIVAALAVLFVFASGQALRQIEWTTPQGEPFRVALLQGNISQDMKFQPGRYAATLAAYKRLIESADARLIVLPETAIPRFLDSVDPAYLGELAQLGHDKRADILVGIPVREPGSRYFNSAISLGASPVQRYNKAQLVPFGEYTPTGLGWFVKALNIPMANFTPGSTTPRPLAIAGQTVAPDICVEDAYGEVIIRQLPQASVLVNISNIAWFGDSLAPDQLMQMSRMRSIETGRYMLRATNTGVTAIIDAHGRVTGRLPIFIEAVLNGPAQGYAGATPYVRLGNAPVLILCLLLLVAFPIAKIRIGRRVQPTP